MSNLFTAQDLSEMANAKKLMNEKKEAEILTTYSCDFLFHHILDSISTDTKEHLKAQIMEKMQLGRVPETILWQSTETTFYKDPVQMMDCRRDSWHTNPEMTVEEHAESLGHNNYVTGLYGNAYRIGRTLRLTDCLLLLAYYFGPHFSCRMTRERIHTDPQFHVYKVTIHLRWHPNERPPHIKELVDEARRLYDSRNGLDVCRECDCRLDSDRVATYFCSYRCARDHYD
jgi:hypothetical protein